MWIWVAIAVVVIAATVAAKFIWGRRDTNPSILWIKLILAGLVLLFGLAVFLMFEKGGG